jgi:hypothetical protein
MKLKLILKTNTDTPNHTPIRRVKMKTVKLTVLFKSGVEKGYIIPDIEQSDIDLLYENLRAIGKEAVLSLNEIFTRINLASVVSAEIEILQS